MCVYTERTSGAGLRATRFFSYLAKMAFISGVNLSAFFDFISSMLPYGPFCIAKIQNCVSFEEEEEEERRRRRGRRRNNSSSKDTNQDSQWPVRVMGGVWVLHIFCT